MSLFKPLCKKLDISLNDLLSGEKVKEKEYQEKLEENIINTINYTNEQIKIILEDNETFKVIKNQRYNSEKIDNFRK